MNKFFSCIIVLIISTPAFAYKECSEEIKSVYVGDNGFLWVTFKNGGIANMRDTDVDFKSTLSVLLSAHMAGRGITVRYASDSATCSESRNDIQGIWVN